MFPHGGHCPHSPLPADRATPRETQGYPVCIYLNKDQQVVLNHLKEFGGKKIKLCIKKKKDSESLGAVPRTITWLRI